MPIHFFQEEKYRQETVKTNVDFEPDHVTGLREKIPSDHPSKPNVFKFSPVFDMTTALLWVRSQPLADGDTESIVVWASNAPYLATVKVTGRDTLKIDGQKQNAIKLELRIKGIDKKMQLKEHKLFKGGRGWLSDDDKRIPLRIEADIFIGYVFAELESMKIGVRGKPNVVLVYRRFAKRGGGISLTKSDDENEARHVIAQPLLSVPLPT